jgi:hypothetical protein
MGTTEPVAIGDIFTADGYRWKILRIVGDGRVEGYCLGYAHRPPVRLVCPNVGHTDRFYLSTVFAGLRATDPTLTISVDVQGKHTTGMRIG